MKVNIYYSYDEITGDDKVKVLEVPDEILAMISSNYARYQNFLKVGEIIPPLFISDEYRLLL